MIKQMRMLLRRNSAKPQWPLFDSTQASAVPPGHIVYAIGDIHGRADLFKALLDQMADDAANRLNATKTLVILGDVIDRGPDSRKMLTSLFQLSRSHTNLIVLRGNHEQLLLDVIDGSYDALSIWLRHGGREFLISFDIDVRLIDPDRMRELMAALQRVLRPEIIAWLRKLPVHVQIGDYFFVHAGITPGVPLKQQDDFDMLWIREEFCCDPGPHPAVIVHGHTIAADGPVLLPYRIGLDTGAYRTGILSGLVLEGTQRRILQSLSSRSRGAQSGTQMVISDKLPLNFDLIESIIG